MKKYKTLAYILVALFIVLGISFAYYQVMSSNSNKEAELKQKAKTEIKYVESKILTLFNLMNDIQFENYKITIKEISPSSSGESSEKSTEESTKSGEGGMGMQTESASNKNEGNQPAGSESTETYSMEPIGVLLSDEKIDWEKAKSAVENIYISIPTITLDLYKTDVEDESILKFNTEFDALTKQIESQKKQETLEQLVKVYENVVKFTEKIGSEQDEIIAKTKLNIYRAYSKLDEGNWEGISKDIKTSIEEFTKMLTGAEVKEEKQYSINKIYIMLSELEKAIEQKHTQIFLIKYKNTLEELSNI